MKPYISVTLPKVIDQGVHRRFYARCGGEPDVGLQGLEGSEGHEMAVLGGQKHGRDAAVVLGIDEGTQLDEGGDGVVVAANGEPVQRRPAVSSPAVVGVCSVRNEFREAGGRGALVGPAGGEEAFLDEIKGCMRTAIK